MTNTFCTIITADYYPYALALYKSLEKYEPSVSLQVLITEGQLPSPMDVPGMRLLPVEDLRDYPMVESLYNKYAHTSMDFFRWSLKPVFINYLLEQGFDKVLYADCDIFFFDDYHFLFDDLDQDSVLLTPQGYNPSPFADEADFISLFTKGVFNAGFIGVNKNGGPVMKWWAEACHFKMGVFRELGIHDDQRYLDAVPALFEKVKIVRHPGCNLSAGNIKGAERTLINGKPVINGRFPIVFIHFNPAMISQIAKGHDPLLAPLLEIYLGAFDKDFMTGNPAIKPGLTVKAGTLARLKWKLRLRTRLRQMLYNLSRKI